MLSLLVFFLPWGGWGGKSLRPLWKRYHCGIPLIPLQHGWQPTSAFPGEGPGRVLREPKTIVLTSKTSAFPFRAIYIL